MSLQKDVKMIDITEKNNVVRIAVAEGKIHLRRETVEKILKGEIKKGDVFSVAKIAAIQAVKKTPEIIPLCHPIPITNVKVDIETNVETGEITVRVKVKSVGKTGVEMEALTGTAAALLNIWDMVKAYEKDEEGQYPKTWIEDIKVLHKEKVDIK